VSRTPESTQSYSIDLHARYVVILWIAWVSDAREHRENILALHLRYIVKPWLAGVSYIGEYPECIIALHSRGI
jgi:hypothetical protein